MKFSTLLPLVIAIPILVPPLTKTPTLNSGLTLPNVFRSNKNTYYVLPSKQVFYGAVSAPAVRADSRFIAFVGDPNLHREVPHIQSDYNETQNLGAKQSLYTIDLRTGNLRKVVAMPSQLKVMYFPGNSKLLWITTIDPVTLGETHKLYNPETNSFKTLPDSVSEFCKGTTPRILEEDLLIFHVDTIGHTILHTYSLSNQQWTRTIVSIESTYTSDDGSNLLVYKAPTEVSEELGAKPIGQINLQTGAVVPLNYDPGPTRIAPPFETSEFDSRVELHRFRGGFFNFLDDQGESLQHINPFEVIIPESLTLTNRGLASGSTPDGKFAFYVEQSGLFLSDITTLTDQQLSNYEYEFVKNVAMSRAKQVGTGMMIYCADYDDHFPLANDVNLMLRPYLESDSLFVGFAYLLNGENATKFDNIQQVIVGKIATPFGTAFLRGDGSVVWQDKQKFVEINLKF